MAIWSNWPGKTSASIYDSLAAGFKIRLDIHQSIILGNALTTTGRTRLQISSSQTHGDVCEKVISGFARPMRHENGPAE